MDGRLTAGTDAAAAPRPAGGRNLHRFAHLSDDDIGTLPLEWNWLVGEYGPNEDAKLVHFTLGIPAIAAYEKCDYSREWFEHFYKVSGCE